MQSTEKYAKVPEVCMIQWKYTKVPESTQMHLKVQKSTGKYAKNNLKYSKVLERTQKYLKICKSTRKYAKSIWNAQKYRKVRNRTWNYRTVPKSTFCDFCTFSTFSTFCTYCTFSTFCNFCSFLPIPGFENLCVHHNRILKSNTCMHQNKQKWTIKFLFFSILCGGGVKFRFLYLIFFLWFLGSKKFQKPNKLILISFRGEGCPNFFLFIFFFGGGGRAYFKFFCGGF